MHSTDSLNSLHSYIKKKKVLSNYQTNFHLLELLIAIFACTALLFMGQTPAKCQLLLDGHLVCLSEIFWAGQRAQAGVC